jgi:hypothetical protein
VKTCPNLSCPARSESGKAPEYDDKIEFCPECGTELVLADAASDDDPAVQAEPALPEERSELPGGPAALLASFESQEDVDLCVQECERHDIPIMVVPSAGASKFEAEMQDAADALPAFDVYVRQADLFRAMSVILELFGDEADEETGDADDDERRDYEENEWDAEREP